MKNGAQCVVQTNFNIPDEVSKWRLEFFGTRGRLMGDTIIGQNDGGKLNFVAACGKAAVAKGAHAGNIVREVAKIAQGGGGGRPDFATAGAKNAEKIDEALAAVTALIEGMVK
jgi:alanyl-tRNA synthetase